MNGTKLCVLEPIGRELHSVVGHVLADEHAWFEHLTTIATKNDTIETAITNAVPKPSFFPIHMSLMARVPRGSGSRWTS